MDSPHSFTSRLQKPSETRARKGLVAGLRESILLGDQPPGTPIPIDAVARFFDVSRIPVREALKALVAEGLVEHRPYVGYRVVNLTNADLAELYEVRHALESTALPVAARRATAEDHASARAVHERLQMVLGMVDARVLHLASRQFHMALLAPSKMPLLLQMYETTWNLVAPAQLMSRLSHDTLKVLQRDHDRMLAAFVAGDVHALLAAADRHHFRLTRAIGLEATRAGLPSQDRAQDSPLGQPPNPVNQGCRQERCHQQQRRLSWFARAGTWRAHEGQSSPVAVGVGRPQRGLHRAPAHRTLGLVPVHRFQAHVGRQRVHQRQRRLIGALEASLRRRSARPDVGARSAHAVGARAAAGAASHGRARPRTPRSPATPRPCRRPQPSTRGNQGAAEPVRGETRPYGPNTRTTRTFTWSATNRTTTSDSPARPRGNLPCRTWNFSKRTNPRRVASACPTQGTSRRSAVSNARPARRVQPTAPPSTPTQGLLVCGG